MARRIIRDYEKFGHKNKNTIKTELENYLDHSRIGHTDMLTDVKPTCDLIINGEKKPEELAKVIMEILYANNEVKRFGPGSNVLSV